MREIPPVVTEVANILATKLSIRWGAEGVPDPVCGYEDIHAVALAAGWEASVSYEGEPPFKVVYRSGRRAVVDYLRRVRGDARSARGRSAMQANGSFLRFDNPDYSDALRPWTAPEAESLVDIGLLWSRLTPTAAAAFAGVEAGYTIREVAAQRGCSPQNLHTSRARARQRLAAYWT